MTQPDPIAVLRAAGHDEAAALLTALKPAPAAEGETPAPQTPQTPAANPYEAQRQAEGRVLLEALHAGTQGQWGIAPVSDEPPQ